MMKANVGRKAKTELINIVELNKWIISNSNRKAGIKCQALISLKKGVSVNDICKVLDVSRESVRLWRKIIETDGPDGFIMHPKTGRKSGLTDGIKTFLKASILKSPSELGYKQVVWDGKLICKLLNEKKAINISVRTAQYWLRKMDFTRQMPRKKYTNSNDAENEAFKKNRN